MQPLLYSELVAWYPLVDPPSDHLEEATCYQQAFERAASPRPETLLELGSGAGHNAFHLKRSLHCTLTDISAEMLALSRERNPECEHSLGDLRTLRLGRYFDVVLVHDAIGHMLTEADLRAAAETAFVHTRSGGAAIFTPDCMTETFSEGTELYEGEDGSRALRCMAWRWRPHAPAHNYYVDYTFLLREGDSVKAVHDQHRHGLFPKAVWLQILSDVGYRVETFQRPIGDGEFDENFLCVRP